MTTTSIYEIIKAARNELPKTVEVTRYSGRELELFDSQVQGYDKMRNLARIKINNVDGEEKITYQIFNGDWYKYSNYTEATNLEEVLNKINHEITLRK